MSRRDAVAEGIARMICPSCQAENSDSSEVCFECREILHAVTRGYVVAERYQIEGTLGKGGMGVVYAAHDRVLDERVALKTLRADFAENEEVARRFLTEIKLARKVGHRNVCRIYEYGEDQGLRFIAMEYVDGVDLRQLLRRKGPLPAEEAFDLAIQTVRGVEAVHEVGIVHRDLKATNIMVDPRGVVRLMDFGIARQESDATRGGLTGTGQILGTPEYMSPEQARGEKVDFRSDVYALGVVIYEIFTGRVPFRGPTPMATLFMHVQEPPPLEGEAAARIPPSVVGILRRCLAKDAGERYGSAQELLDALVAARAAARPAAASLGPGDLTIDSLPPWVRRPRRRSFSWSVTGVLALGAAALVLLRGDSLSGLLPLAVTPPSPRAEPPSPPPAAPLPTPEPQGSVAPAPLAGSGSSAWTEPLRLQPSPGTETPVAPPSGRDSPLTPAAESRGVLRLAVVPFARVTVDEEDAGTVVSNQMPLAAGRHVLVLVHPDFEPLRRTVEVPAGETVEVRIELARDGVRKESAEK